MAVKPPKSIEVKLKLKVLEVAGIWEPNNSEREAAWELYVELLTRAAVVPLRYGLLREALASLYSLFASSREVLRRYGPRVAEPKGEGELNLGFLVVAMLNCSLRPVLSYWHPELEAWENSRPEGNSRLEHERSWKREPELRAALEMTRHHLDSYSRLLARACGVEDLSNAIPKS